jgi:hypothetical protein
MKDFFVDTRDVSSYGRLVEIWFDMMDTR